MTSLKTWKRSSGNNRSGKPFHLAGVYHGYWRVFYMHDDTEVYVMRWTTPQESSNFKKYSVLICPPNAEETDVDADTRREAFKQARLLYYLTR